MFACALLTLLPDYQFAPPWLAVIVGLIILWRMFIWWRHAALPPRWLLTLMVVAGSIGVFLSFRQFFGKDPGIALLILFLSLKLLELRSVRDALTIVFLCYFLLLTHFLDTQTMELAGLTFVAIVVITAALASLGRADGSVKTHVRLSVLMLGQAIPFMLVFFLLFPRVQGPLWGLPSDAYSGMTGLSDSMSPGSIGNLSLSGEIAFRVQFEGGSPPMSALYWRGPVLWQFDGRTWRAGVQQTGEQLPYEPTGEAYRYAVTLEPHNKTWLFALEMPGSLPVNALITSASQLLSKMPVRNRLRYEVISHPGLVLGADEPPPNLKWHLQLPAGNPRTRALVAGWRRDLGSDEKIIARMLDHFRQENFHYTLTPPLLGEQSIDDFLFRTRRGFCEHFAATFVFAMRAAGIPSRIVTGYQGGEMNPIDGYMIVRQSDAHAWAEVWLDGRGWLRIDPTAAIAPSRIEAGLASAMAADEPLPFMVRADLSWLRSLRFRWEALSNSWNQWVLGYNPQRQREVLARLGLREPDWRAMTGIMTVLCGILLLGLTVWAVRKRIRLDPTVLAWNRLSRKLARIGLARNVWEGPLDYSRRIAQARPELAISVEGIAVLYIGLRYGRLSGKEPQRHLQGLVADLKIATP